LIFLGEAGWSLGGVYCHLANRIWDGTEEEGGKDRVKGVTGELEFLKVHLSHVNVKWQGCGDHS
jgi:hypothetical protein